jgi:hypothetical protein
MPCHIDGMTTYRIVPVRRGLDDRFSLVPEGDDGQGTYTTYATRAEAEAAKAEREREGGTR